MTRHTPGTPAALLPTTRAEIDELGWEAPDVILVSGDASIDHPSFAAAILGRWLERNGESIYGTRGGPIGPRTWGATTQRDSPVYVHVPEWQDDALLIPSLPSRVASAAFMDGRPATFSETDAGVVIQLPSDARDEFDTVISLELVD